MAAYGELVMAAVRCTCSCGTHPATGSSLPRAADRQVVKTACAAPLACMACSSGGFRPLRELLRAAPQVLCSATFGHYLTGS